MRGDFSAWNKDRSNNFRGTLHQQGRVLSDRDWNAQTEVIGEWQEAAGRDAFGAGVLAVPAELPDSFKVINAAISGTGDVDVSLLMGRAWADGLMVELHQDVDPRAIPGGAIRRATYLGPPIQSLPLPPTAGSRDAVILETWLEELSQFQMPDLLLEPALGGVDTTERVHTASRLRLYRMGQTDKKDTCESIIDDLKDKFKAKGMLTVELKPNTSTGGDCPVVMEGGFTGFEHRLYRFEIAETSNIAPYSKTEPYFKWSHFNGGLVGRGVFHPPDSPGDDGKLSITHNQNAIVYSGSKKFYLEALVYDQIWGYWRVAYGVDNVTLESDGTLKLPGAAADQFVGPMPLERSGGQEITHFFRLWNGIEKVSEFLTKKDFPNAADTLGLQVQFDTAAMGSHSPGDFWTFEVRAGEIGNPLILVGKAPANPGDAVIPVPPAGICHHRVPLAELNWTGNTVSGDDIEDCRRVFDPLTDLSGCCIEVKPGEDIHRALKKIFDAGGGCLCLLPGDHKLTRPIDLTGRSSIRIGGFGRESRLYVTSKVASQAPFILTNTKDVSLQSFVVVNQTPLPLCLCGNTVGLRVEGVVALSGLRGRGQPVFALKESCHRWSLENNVLVGAVGLSGRLLASSAILDNVWIGASRGIDLTYAQDLQIERNNFLGIHDDRISDFDNLTGDMASGLKPLASGLALTNDILTSTNAAVAPSYVGIEVNGAFDVDIIDNRFYGAVGMRLEWTENCLIQRNRFLTLVTATVCGVAHGFEFNENRIGVAADDRRAEKPMVCETGLVLLADAVECRIADNVFANVKRGVVFESDHGNYKAITRDFSANLYTLNKVTEAATKELLESAETRAKDTLDRSLLLSSSLFRVGTSKRVVIEGNQFHASEIGIEWSGTTQIYDFRIAGNAFIGCQDVAIQIEPDSRMLLLADPVDTKVRLIENNRFEIFSGAVRATIGAVRVEKNDIRVDAPAFKVVQPIEILKIAADTVFNSPPMAKAAQSYDIPLVSMTAMEATSTVEKNSDVVNANRFARAVDDTILKTYQPTKGDALADQVFVMKNLADLGAKKYLGTIGNALLPKWTFNSEGFVINLAGIQNRVVHNRLFCKNPQRPGGVLFNAVSGEVRDNEIVVPGTALLLSGKLGLASGYTGVEICDNSLASVGIAGSKTAVYALAIPGLSPGNLTINDNIFKGSVMIGGDPLSAQGFSNNKVLVFPGVFTFYNVMKLDMATYAASSLVKAFPMKPGIFGVFRPPGAIFQRWLTDPHASRPIIHFCQNRVIQGWVGIFQALSGAYWSAALLRSQANQALIANIANNIFDYGGSTVGHELLITGNHSQAALKYRVGGQVQAVANIPAAVSF